MPDSTMADELAAVFEELRAEILSRYRALIGDRAEDLFHDLFIRMLEIGVQDPQNSRRYIRRAMSMRVKNEIRDRKRRGENLYKYWKYKGEKQF